MPLVHSVIPSVLIAMTSFFGICVSDPPYWVAPIAVEQGSASASPDRSTIVAYSGEAVNLLTGFILATFYAEQLETLDGPRASHELSVHIYPCNTKGAAGSYSLFFLLRNG